MARAPGRTAIERIVELQQQIRGLESQRQGLIEAARAEEATWQAIADALGVSRQAAWESADRGRRALERVRTRRDLDEAAARELASEALAEVRAGR